jgi:hypothetical protein
VGGELLHRGFVRPRRTQRPCDGEGAFDEDRIVDEGEARLATADQLEIDGSEQFAVEQGAVLGACREIDGEAPAERVETGLGAGKPAARQRQRILDLAAQLLLADAAQLGIEEFDVELGVMDDQPTVADEFEELLDMRGERRMRRQELGREPVHRIGVLRHIALGIDVAMEDAAGRHVIDELDAADLDDAMPVIGIESRRLGVEHDLAHAVSVLW